MKHRWSKARTAFAVIAFLNLLTACSVKMNGPETPAAPPDKFLGKPRVDGPSVEGMWATSCVIDRFQSKKWSFVFAGDTFSRTQEDFTDQYCQSSKSKTTYVGSFIFSVNFPTDKSYEISYAIDSGNGTTTIKEEKLLIEGGVLYVNGEFLTGETAPVNRSMPMVKQQTTNPTPSPSPTNCQNYSGRYQMNSDNFQIQQTDCQKVEWTVFGFGGPNKVITYIMDGVERFVDGTNIKTSWANGLFKREYITSGRAVTEVWSFLKKPCNLSNPDGEDYLTRNVWIDGKEAPNLCEFYSKY